MKKVNDITGQEELNLSEDKTPGKIKYYGQDGEVHMTLDKDNIDIKGENKMTEEKYTIKDKVSRFYKEHKDLYLGIGLGLGLGSAIVLYKYAEVRVNKDALKEVKKAVTIAPKR